MTKKRILLLGVTGIDKQKVVAERLKPWCKEHYGQNIIYVDFEKKYLSKQRLDFSQILAEGERAQFECWGHAWSELNHRARLRCAL